MSNIKEGGCKSLCQLFSWSMAAIFRDCIVVRTRPRTIPPAMKTVRKSIYGFSLLCYMGMGLRLVALLAAGARLWLFLDVLHRKNKPKVFDSICKVDCSKSKYNRFSCVLVCLSFVAFVLWAWHRGIINDFTRFDAYTTSEELHKRKYITRSKLKAGWDAGILVCLQECRKISKTSCCLHSWNRTKWKNERAEKH